MTDAPLDAIALLKADHRKVEDLFEKFGAAQVLIAEIEAGSPAGEFYDSKKELAACYAADGVPSPEARTFTGHELDVGAPVGKKP